MIGQGKAVMVRTGVAWCGEAWHGLAVKVRLVKERRGAVRFGGRGLERCGADGFGLAVMAKQGPVRQGGARRSCLGEVGQG